MNGLVFIENGRPVTDSLTVSDVFTKEHARVLRDIRDLGCSDEFRLGNFADSYYVNHQRRRMPRIILSEQGLMLLVMGYTGEKAMEIKERFIAEFERMRKALNEQSERDLPKSGAEMFVMVAQQFLEQENRVKRVEQQLEVANHRIDNLDAVNVIGDLQQRLTSMVKRYAHSNGLSFQKGWRDFTAAYNTAYHTNLTALIENYKEKHGLRDLTRPQFLSMTGRLEDAIRVTDKLLNLELVTG